eukprot:g1621.t1
MWICDAIKKHLLLQFFFLSKTLTETKPSALALAPGRPNAQNEKTKAGKEMGSFHTLEIKIDRICLRDRLSEELRSASASESLFCRLWKWPWVLSYAELC